MSASHFEAIDETLLLLSEARERAERAAREIRSDEAGQAHLAEALETVDRELLALHRRLMDETLFHAPTTGEKQLALNAA